MEKPGHLDSRESQLNSEYQLQLDKFAKVNSLTSFVLPSGKDGFVFNDKSLTNKPNLFPIVEDLNRSNGKIEIMCFRSFADTLKLFFAEQGYSAVKPHSIIIKGGTTLFITAGVQILDEIIFDEAPLPKEKIFIAQPVFRTQYIDAVNDGSVTGFVNLTTLDVNNTIENHFTALSEWLVMLQKLGFDRSDFILEMKDSSPKWGEKKFKNKIIKVYYKGVEIGDAVFIYDLPQSSRPALRISDIGFGAERIMWLMGEFDFFNQIISAGTIETSPAVIDHCRTLALLFGSGLEPGNKDHGYRIRQLSKRLTGKRAELTDSDLKSLFVEFYIFWEIWTNLNSPEQEATQKFQRENSRNFNRCILDTLSTNYSDIDVDINLPGDKFLVALKGTSITQADLKKITRIYEDKNQSR